MPETLSLLQLAGVLKSAIDSEDLLQNVWVVAEISDLRSSGGHVYLELVEKDARGSIVAKIKATIWRGTWGALCGRYPTLRQGFVAGNEVRVRGSVQFHQQYGLSFNLTDFDPDYTRDTTRLQLEILAALKREGILEANKSADLHLPPQKIAVISGATAAGYGDFMNQLTGNQYGFQFYTRLYAAAVQGAQTSASIRQALAEIETCVDLYDCVVIIRGGGATTDLSGFDDLELARAVAQFPLPVVVGIGHERDNTVLDFIAHTRVKTPTAAAEWLVAQSLEAFNSATTLATTIARYVEERLQGELRQTQFLEEKIPFLARRAAEQAAHRLEQISAALPLMVKNRLLGASRTLDAALQRVRALGERRLALESQRLSGVNDTLRRDTALLIQMQRQRLAQAEQLIRVLDPANTLRRGYSITRMNGHALTDATQAKEGSEIVTTLHNGRITSRVEARQPQADQ